VPGTGVTASGSVAGMYGSGSLGGREIARSLTGWPRGLFSSVHRLPQRQLRAWRAGSRPWA
jgi:hypothetical protein